MTLDFCRADVDCSNGLACLQQGNEESFNGCTASDYETCQCIPSDEDGFTYCESAEDACPPGEGCGKNKVTGDTICLSCRQIRDSGSGFTAVDPDVCPASTESATSPTTSFSGSPVPMPPRRSLDWCSLSEPCDEGLTCVGRFPSKCKSTDLGCYCSYNPEIPCRSANMCTDPDETCAYNTERGNTRCVSCNVIATEIFYQPYKNNRNCKTIVPLPTPEFLPPSNGLFEDRCFFDIGCQPPYLCAMRNGEPCEIHSASCTCQNAENDAQLCGDTSECRSGEVCAKTTDEPQCLSISHLLGLPQANYEVLGDFPERGNNVTGDICRIDYDCVDGLYCTHEFNNFPPGGCIGRRACSCRGLQFQLCTSSDDCRAGEVCVNVPDARNDAYCYSAQQAAIDPYVREISETPSPTPTVLPTDGWTGDLCKQDRDCKKGNVVRRCRHYLERPDVGPCNGRDFCVCKPPFEDVCGTDSDCVSGEVCVQVKDTLPVVPGECISEKLLELEIYDPIYSRVQLITPLPSEPSLGPSLDLMPSLTPDTSLSPPSMTTSPSNTGTANRSPSSSASPSASWSPTVSSSQSPVVPSEEPSSTAVATNDLVPIESPDASICVDADALAHLPPTQLVYAEARRAVVLCDEQGSCATSGHIVHWLAVPMMMQTYCERYATCTRRIKHVNSPRMRRRLRIPTRTDGLEFTPLAARFATTVEEAILRQILWFGF